MPQPLDPKLARLLTCQEYLDSGSLPGKAFPQPAPSARGKRLIVVGGAPRSGTTMFQSMMDSHAQVHGGPEFDHLPDISRLHDTLTQTLQNGRTELLVTQEQIDDAIAQLIESLLLPAADRRGKRYLSEKTPGNILEFGHLMRILPRARFVHIVRDPRAVFVSMMKVGQRLDTGGHGRPDFIANPEKILAYITRCVTAGVAACESALDRSITIRYEDLITRTAYIMEKALQALGLPNDEAVSKPASKPHENEHMLRDGSDPWAGGRTSFTDPEPENLDKWRKDLSPENINVLNRHFSAYPIYRALGYTFD